MYTQPFWYMKLNFWIQWGYAWQRVEYAIYIWTTGLRRMDLHCSFFFFYPFCFIVEFQTASRSVVSFCGSSHTAATAAARQMSWHHAVWHCELHLLVSTCGWLMCCFIYILSCLSLIHPRMSLPMLCKSDHRLSLVLLFISFSFSCWFPVLTDNGYMCSHIICITI